MFKEPEDIRLPEQKLQGIVSHKMWVLGAEPSSSAGAEHGLHRGAISPAQHCRIFQDQNHNLSIWPDTFLKHRLYFYQALSDLLNTMFSYAVLYITSQRAHVPYITFKSALPFQWILKIIQFYIHTNFWSLAYVGNKCKAGSESLLFSHKWYIFGC